MRRLIAVKFYLSAAFKASTFKASASANILKHFFYFTLVSWHLNLRIV
jgi:hypothetical protein